MSRGCNKIRVLGGLAAAVIFAVTLFLCPVSAMVAPAPAGGEAVRQVADGIIRWKKAQLGLAGDDHLLQGEMLCSAGTGAADWYAFALARLDWQDDYLGYLAALKGNIRRRYAENGGLDDKKATEWHRAALVMLATGGDPTHTGTAQAPIDLIADGIYLRDETNPLSAQGVNGLIWGLIALDALVYEPPPEALAGREEILSALLAAQGPQGGFDLSGVPGDRGDVDLTAMAMTALAPYYTGRIPCAEPAGVEQAVEKGLVYIAASQRPGGDLNGNLESTAQGMIALCSLGIDPLNDARFIKGGATLLDGIMKYRQADGGFSHDVEGDASGLPAMDASNNMAGEQALCALAAYSRHLAGMRPLYDCRPEAAALSAAAATASLRVNESDLADYDGLAAAPAGEDYQTVLRLIEKISAAENGAEYGWMLEDLTARKAGIEAIHREIESINAQVVDSLYPLEKVGPGKAEMVNGILGRINALGEYDRAQVLRYEDILAAKARIESAKRGIVIAIVLAVVVAAAVGILARRALRRRAAKRAATGGGE